MAIFTNVVVLNDDWYNVNTLSGAAVGTAILIQNISSGNCILKESSTKPTNDNGPILFDCTKGELSKALVDTGSLAIWAKCVGSPNKAILAVYE